MRILAVFAILLALGSALGSSKHMEFEKHLFVPRTPEQIEMDRLIPIHMGEHGQSIVPFHPLLIHYDTSNLEHIKNENSEMYTFMNTKLIPAVVKHMSDTFKVREVQLNRVSVDKCSEQPIPANLKTDIKADLILIFTAEATKEDSFVAWASACQLHRTTLRPTVGRVNMNPYYLSTEPKKFFDQFGTTLHEVYHVLGFSRSLYKYFINPVTMKRRVLTETFIENAVGKFPLIIVTPKVVEFTRRHFNCPKMRGMPVENEGEAGSKGSHWEKFLLGNEMMVSDTVANPIVSEFSLRLFEDSGWYQINYSMAEPIFWGRNAGCSILDGNCAMHGKKCITKGEEGCFYDYTFQATCSSDQFSDMCTFFTGTDFNVHDCRVLENRDSDSDALGEFFGFKSRCFAGKLAANGYYQGNMCYKATCSKGAINLVIGNSSYQCLSSGQKIVPKGMKKYVICPDIKDFCDQLNASCDDDCSLNGRCLSSKKCRCYPGFSGPKCQNVGGNGGVHKSASSNDALVHGEGQLGWWD